MEDENEMNNLANNKMSIEELEARMKEIEKKIASKGKSKPGADRKRDGKRKDKEEKSYIKQEDDGDVP